MSYVYRPLTAGPNFNAQLNETLRDIEQSMRSDSRSAAPTGGAWKLGDFVRNSAPSEAGTTPNKYVVIGWSCIASGTPGTWVECRCLTGN